MSRETNPAETLRIRVGVVVCYSARAPLREHHFDVAIIGGGINGVALARECARARRSVLLLEQHDFASGTTSRATRIIHGGLRYLEHGEISLVRESLRERERLLRERPHLVRSLEFVLAVPRHFFGRRSALAIRTGLWLYGLAAGVRHCTAAAARAQAVRDLEAALDKGLNLELYPYEDAQCEYPERLVGEWLAGAMEDGAIARNYTRVLAVEAAEGRARALRLRDLVSGQESRVTADWIVNAAGPWVDQVLQGSTSRHRRLVGGVRGSHLLLPRFPGCPHSAVYAEATDGRPVFLLPWAGQYLFGTTEVASQAGDDPGDAAASPAELEYLFRSFCRLFPRSGLEWKDIRGSYSGVRPLPYEPDRRLSDITRRHILHDHLEDGVARLISIIGGKLTTAASLARDCARKMGISVADPSSPIVAAGDSAVIENTFREWSARVSDIAGISRGCAASLAEWHGRQALGIARFAARDETLRQPLCRHTCHIVAEAVHATLHEGALTLADILLRRVPVALGRCWSPECTREAAQRLASVFAWSVSETSQAIEDFEMERAHFIRPVSGTGNPLPAVPAPQPS